MKEKFPNTRKPFHQQICGEFWNLRGQHNQKKKKERKKTQNSPLTTSPSREIAQTLVCASSKQGLNSEVQVACLG